MFNTILIATTIIAAICGINTISFIRLCGALEEHSKNRQSDFRLEQPGFRPWHLVNGELVTRRFRSGLVALVAYAVGMVLAIYMMNLHQGDGQFIISMLAMVVLCGYFAAMAISASLQEDRIWERFAAQLPG